MQALRRELKEELRFEFDAARSLGRFDFDFSGIGIPVFTRLFFEVLVTPQQRAGMVLGEGADLRAFDTEHLLASERVTPYDGFALWCYVNRGEKN